MSHFSLYGWERSTSAGAGHGGRAGPHAWPLLVGPGSTAAQAALADESSGGG